MKLLISQRDEVYSAIEEAGLSPAQFEISDNLGIKNPKQTATVVKFKNSDYYFRFETSTSSNEKHYAVYCPGEEVFRKEDFPGSWYYQIGFFKGWLNNLKREINSPNKWERLKHELEGITFDFDHNHNEDKFSVQEYEVLKQKTEVLKESIKTINLLPDQLEGINNKLDHLVEMAKEMNKFDWKGLFIGSIVGMIIQLSVTPENAKALWAIIGQVFNQNFLLP